MVFNPILLFLGSTAIGFTAVHRTLVRSWATGGILRIAASTVVGLGITESKTGNEQNSGAERQYFIFHVVGIEKLEDMAPRGLWNACTTFAGGCHTEL